MNEDDDDVDVDGDSWYLNLNYQIVLMDNMLCDGLNDFDYYSYCDLYLQNCVDAQGLD